MSLVTEKTSVVYEDTNQRTWPTKEKAETASIAAAINEAAQAKWVIDPHVLVALLQANPEVKQWLLQQLGFSKAVMNEHNTTKGIHAAHMLVQEIAASIAENYEGFHATERLRRAIDSDANAFIYKLVKGIAPYLSIAAQPQEEINGGAILYTALNYKRSADAMLDMQKLEEAGYKLVKA